MAREHDQADCPGAPDALVQVPADELALLRRIAQGVERFGEEQRGTNAEVVALRAELAEERRQRAEERRERERVERTEGRWRWFDRALAVGVAVLSHFA